MNKRNHYARFLCSGIVGIIFALFAAVSFGIFAGSVWKSPANPSWNSLFYFGFVVGVAHSQIFLSSMLWRTRRQADAFAKTLAVWSKSPERKRILTRRLTFLSISLLVYFAIWAAQNFFVHLEFLHVESRPGFFSVGDVPSFNPVRHWLEAIPCLIVIFLSYLATTYPYSFKWPR